MKDKIVGFSIVVVSLSGCLAPGELMRPELPSLSYSKNVHSQRSEGVSQSHVAPQSQVAVSRSHRGEIMDTARANISDSVSSPQFRTLNARDARASLHFVNDRGAESQSPSEVISNMGDAAAKASADYTVSRPHSRNVRPYQGPLHVGEPGASSSLWRMQGPGSQLFRDHRAFQPMDLITVVVSETAQGSKEADTETKRESSFLAGITELFNFTDSLQLKNPGLDTATMLDADFQSEFTGEGETTRKGSLQAKIAAMVVEVLPNGTMRIEGEKIIAVNNEEQVLVISGLVRPRDVNSMNEVMSTKIAHLRVDYFGKGLIGDVQSVGWFGRFVNKIWPF